MLLLVATLQVIVEQIAQLESEIAQALGSHPDGAIFRSFFRSSVICSATLLAESGDSRARYPHRDAIAPDAGRAPVAAESGKRKSAKFRWACNKRLRRRWIPSSTPAAEPTPGPPTDTPTPAPAATTTAAHYKHGRAWSRIMWRC